MGERVGRSGGEGTRLRRGGAAVAGAVAALAGYDLTQRRHAILRNYPVVGHMRYLLESIGPELRQYIVASNDEERPFSRVPSRAPRWTRCRAMRAAGSPAKGRRRGTPSTAVSERRRARPAERRAARR